MSNWAQLVKHKQAIDVDLITRFLCYITVTSIQLCWTNATFKTPIKPGQLVLGAEFPRKTVGIPAPILETGFFFLGYILTSTKGLLLSFHPPPTCQAVFVYLALVCAWRSKGIGCNEGRRNDPKFCSQIPAGVAGAGTSGGEVPLIVIVIDLVIQICLVYVTRSLAVNQQFPQSVFAYLSPNSASSSAKQQSSVP